MNIAILVPTLTIGGAEKVALTLCSALNKRNCKVTLVVLSKQVGYQPPQDVNVVFVTRGLVHLYLFFLNHQFSVVVSLLERANAFNFICSFFFNWKCFLSVHTPPSGAFSLRKAGYIIKVFYRIVSFFPSRKVICVSKGVMNEMRELFSIKSLVCIPNPIDVDEVVRLSKVGCVDVFFPTDRVHISFFGRLSKIKGARYLIDASGVAIEREGGILPLIHIFGSGDELPSLKALAQKRGCENIIFHGSVNNPFPYMSNSDYVIVPSLYEGFGLVVVEALSLRCKVIASSCPYGPREILSEETGFHVGNNKFGYLLPDFSSDREHAIDHLAAVLLQIARGGVCDVEPEVLYQRAKEYDIDLIGDKYYELLSE